MRPESCKFAKMRILESRNPIQSREAILQPVPPSDDSAEPEDPVIHDNGVMQNGVLHPVGIDHDFPFIFDENKKIVRNPHFIEKKVIYDWEDRLDEIDKKLNDMEKRLDNIDKRIDGMEKRFDDIVYILKVRRRN